MKSKSSGIFGIFNKRYKADPISQLHHKLQKVGQSHPELFGHSYITPNSVSFTTNAPLPQSQDQMNLVKFNDGFVMYYDKSIKAEKNDSELAYSESNITAKNKNKSADT